MDGFRIVVMALASSSCTVLPVAVLASVINTYYTQTRNKHELLVTMFELNRIGKLVELCVTLTRLVQRRLKCNEGTQMVH